MPHARRGVRVHARCPGMPCRRFSPAIARLHETRSFQGAKFETHARSWSHEPASSKLLEGITSDM